MVKLAEGLETNQFWEALGGKGRHAHFDVVSSLPYILPRLYRCDIGKDPPMFTEQLPTDRDELKRDRAYILSYKQQVNNDCVYVLENTLRASSVCLLTVFRKACLITP